MKILLLSTSMGMGGADQQVLAGAWELRLRGHEVFIVSLTPLGPMGLEARSSGIPTESLEMPPGLPDPRGLLRLVRLVRRWRPDVLHSHMVHANLLARALRPFVRVPALISTIHNINEGGRRRMAAYRLTNRLVDRMTVISQAAADRFVADGIVPKELLRVIPNGVDTSRFRNVSAETRASMRKSLGIAREFVWMALGRFETQKDYPNMLRAFARVRQHAPGTVLLLAGQGSLRGETEALAQALHPDNSVRFLGMRHDVPELLSAADGYVMSSAWEGMPVVLLEAASAGLPIVATSVGGNHEVVCQGESGFLVRPSDPDALGQAMQRLMGLTETERRSLGERGRNHVGNHYGLGKMVENWEELYREVLAANGVGSLAVASGESGAPFGR